MHEIKLDLSAYALYKREFLRSYQKGKFVRMNHEVLKSMIRSELTVTAGVYFLIDKFGVVFYIGMSMRLFTRLRTHLSATHGSKCHLIEDIYDHAYYIPIDADKDWIQCIESILLNHYQPELNLKNEKPKREPDVFDEFDAYALLAEEWAGGIHFCRFTCNLFLEERVSNDV